jgi:signal transduction histidine kinase
MSAPSMRARLGWALLSWSMVWSSGVAVAVWLAARHEVNELLDDGLIATAEVLAELVARDGIDGSPAPARAGRSNRFAWQLVGPDARVLIHSVDAPETALRAPPGSGFSQTPTWRVYGMPLETDGRMLYVAQAREERREAQLEVATAAVLSTLAIGLLGQVWLRFRIRHELAPLRSLSLRLERYEPGELPTPLGAAERQEFEPMHRALDDLGRRLEQRLSTERAFSAHAAHALRTPLAGIDAQLAAAMAGADEPTRARLRRARDAAGRLQRVVVALIGLFRTGTRLQRGRHELRELLNRLPVEGLEVIVEGEPVVDADPDLLTAALANLLDNASRKGASRVRVEAPEPTIVRVHNDGPGVSPERRAELQAVLSSQAYESGAGLGLMLADRVARSHGGSLHILDVETGFAVEIRLRP